MNNKNLEIKISNEVSIKFNIKEQLLLLLKIIINKKDFIFIKNNFKISLSEEKYKDISKLLMDNLSKISFKENNDMSLLYFEIIKLSKLMKENKEEKVELKKVINVLKEKKKILEEEKIIINKLDSIRKESLIQKNKGKYQKLLNDLYLDPSMKDISTDKYGKKIFIQYKISDSIEKHNFNIIFTNQNLTKEEITSETMKITKKLTGFEQKITELRIVERKIGKKKKKYQLWYVK